jgi:hypothetical protein
MRQVRPAFRRADNLRGRRKAMTYHVIEGLLYLGLGTVLLLRAIELL